MSMLYRTMQSESNVNVTGFAIAYSGTAEMLAEWIGAPMDEVILPVCWSQPPWHGILNINERKDAHPLINKRPYET